MPIFCTGAERFVTSFVFTSKLEGKNARLFSGTKYLRFGLWDRDPAYTALDHGPAGPGIAAGLAGRIGSGN